jgi:hypothetical protein
LRMSIYMVSNNISLYVFIKKLKLQLKLIKLFKD